MMGVAVTDLKFFGMGGKLLRKKGPNRKGAPKRERGSRKK